MHLFDTAGIPPTILVFSLKNVSPHWMSHLGPTKPKEQFELNMAVVDPPFPSVVVLEVTVVVVLV
jgi:hypothetical protein